MRHDIFNYLQSSGFDISMTSLANIQGKDYRAIFDFLLLTLDPSHPLSSNARFEDEFVPALKSLRYPFAHQIDNKWLAAPASMHSWPSLLGVLHWLAELCKVRGHLARRLTRIKILHCTQLRGHYLCNAHPTLQNPNDIPEEFDDPCDHQGLAFDYYEQAYTVWLDLIDDFVEPNQYLEDRYGLFKTLFFVVDNLYTIVARKDEGVQADLEERTNQLNQSKIEFDKLKSSAVSIPLSTGYISLSLVQAPVAKLQNENGLLTADSEKFRKILQQYEDRKKKLLDTIAYEKAEIATGGKALTNPDYQTLLIKFRLSFGAT
jgi:kinetochore protein NDC80